MKRIPIDRITLSAFLGFAFLMTHSTTHAQQTTIRYKLAKLDREIDLVQSQIKEIEDGYASRVRGLIEIFEQMESKLSIQVKEITARIKAKGVTRASAQVAARVGAQKAQLRVDLAGFTAKSELIEKMIANIDSTSSSAITSLEMLLKTEQDMLELAQQSNAAGDVTHFATLEQKRNVLDAEVRLAEARTANPASSILRQQLMETRLEIASLEARLEESIRQSEDNAPVILNFEELDMAEEWLQNARTDLAQLDIAQSGIGQFGNDPKLVKLRERLTILQARKWVLEN